MKFFVYTESPMVLKNIELNNVCTIRMIDDKDGFGEEAPFAIEKGNPRFGLDTYICPRCGNRFGAYRRVNYCSQCGLANSETEDDSN